MSERIRKIGNDTEIDRLLNETSTHEVRKEYVEVEDENYCIPVYYVEEEPFIRSMEIRDDDVIIACHPKTGTSWCQEMVWLLLNNFDYDGAKVPLPARSPLIESFATKDFSKTEYGIYKGGKYYERAFGDKPSPRSIKTHLPWSLLPEQIQNGTKKAKIISLMRNAQDVCISYYHYCKTYEGFKGDFDDFAKLFMAGRVMFGPFYENVLSYWNQRHRPNVLILNYKDMIKDLAEVTRTVAKFLEVTYTEEQLKGLLEHLHIEHMKKNDAVNHSLKLNLSKELGLCVEETPFIRSGKEGAYKKEMNPELIEKFKVWTREKFSGTGLTLE